MSYSKKLMRRIIPETILSTLDNLCRLNGKLSSIVTNDLIDPYIPATGLKVQSGFDTIEKIDQQLKAALRTSSNSDMVHPVAVDKLAFKNASKSILTDDLNECLKTIEVH